MNASAIDLTPFRRRIRLLRAGRCAAMGAAAGAVVAVGMALVDLLSIHFFDPWMLAVPVVIGLVAGVLKATFERLDDHIVALSLDRRCGLEDRVASALELPPDSGGLKLALAGDAAGHVAELKPAAVYPLRPGRLQAIAAGIALLAAIIYLGGNSVLFRSAKAKLAAAEMRREANEVQRIANPLEAQARAPGATAQDKALARDLNKLAADLRRGRMSKQDALLRANALAEEARQLEAQHSDNLLKSTNAAQTAGDRLAAMSARANTPDSPDAKLAEQANALQSQIAQMEQALAGSHLSASARAAMEKKLADAKRQLQQIHLSQQAQDFLRRLQANPDYQEAMKLLSQLQQQAGAQQNGQQGQLTQQQLDEIANRMDALAKEYQSDEATRDFAKQLLEAAKAARLGNGASAAALLAAFGMGSGQNSLPTGGNSSDNAGQHGPGSPTSDHWTGAAGKLQSFDKSSLLHVKFQDRVLTSQIGKQGPESYSEFYAPSALGAKPGVPYQQVMPRYLKSAESAMSKDDVPPSLRGQVRDYFDSLSK